MITLALQNVLTTKDAARITKRNGCKKALTLSTSRTSIKPWGSKHLLPPRTPLSVSFFSSSSMECAICWANPAKRSFSSSLPASVVEQEEASTGDATNHCLKTFESHGRSLERGTKSCACSVMLSRERDWCLPSLTSHSSFMLEHISLCTLATSNAILAFNFYGHF